MSRDSMGRASDAVGLVTARVGRDEGRRERAAALPASTWQKPAGALAIGEGDL